MLTAKAEDISHQREFLPLVVRLHQRLISEIDPRRLENIEPTEAREAVESAARELLDEEAPDFYGRARDQVVAMVADEVLGLGPIEPLIRDDTLSEVMVNAPDRVYIERRGLIELSGICFLDAAHIMRVIERIVSPLGRRVDESSPMVDARLADGSRVNAVIPPITRGPAITIRKFKRERFTMRDLVLLGTLNRRLAEFTEACVRARVNILVSGGTGSGKTTFLNVLSHAIPEEERIVTIEDPIELQLNQDHVVAMEARPPNLEGKNQVTQRDLVRNALRMRPDRILVGEVRGGEAFDMMQAMNTGHDGSLSTLHSNSPRDALARVENMVLMASLDLPARAIREQLAAAIQLIIQLARFRDGSRKISQITEVVGMEGSVITTQDLFLYHFEGVDENGMIIGEHLSTGLRPRFLERLEQYGIQLAADTFADEVPW